MRIRTPDDWKWEVKFDLSREELDTRVLKPYASGLPIILGGRTFVPADRARIDITYTDNASAQFATYTKIAVREGERDWPQSEPGAKDLTDELINGPHGQVEHQQPRMTEPILVDPRAIWVVHGRDLNVRDSMFSFLRAIGLKPLEFSSAAQLTGKASPYVGEVLDVAFLAAQAAVVLFTPDDEGRLRSQYQQPEDPPHEKDLTPQARPNVLFEAGMAVGRYPDRTILVEVGTLRPFSDIAGRHIIRLNNSSQRRQELAQRLEVVGCPVDLSGTDWHSVGHFEPTLTDTTVGSVVQVSMDPSFELSDKERLILSFLARDREEQPATKEISQELHEGEQRTLYYLERMEERKLVMRAMSTLRPTEWFLTKKGRAFAVEQDLL